MIPAIARIGRVALLGLALSSVGIQADMPNPPPPGKKVPFILQMDSHSGVALRIPRSMLAGETGGPLNDDRWRQIVVSLLLSAAAVLAGYWAVRRRRHLSATPMGLTALTLALSGLLLHAQAPQSTRFGLELALQELVERNGVTGGEVYLQIVPQGNRIEMSAPAPNRPRRGK